MNLHKLRQGAALLAALLGGCASLAGPAETDSLFEGAAFAPRPVEASAEAVFALDDAMRAFLADEVARRVRQSGPTSGLFHALHDQLQVGYDTAVTRTAREAFASHSGNCLSLVIMTAAFAHELNIPVRYQSVYGGGTWSRSGDLAFHSGHVNLVLGRGVLDRLGGELVIDFEAPTSYGQYVRLIAEDTVLAMYLNNRAAETLADGDLDTAYAFARAAVQRAPAFTASYNTLGVVYLRHGDYALAERALRRALEREPGDANALSNLASVLSAQGRNDEAAALREQLADIQPYPPFWFINQGFAAMLRGDDRAALELFGKELRRMPYDDEVHFAIAVAKLRLGDVREARAQIALALANSTTPERRDIYAAKLAHLQKQR